MTMLDTFLSFAKGLPAERLQSVEAALAALMETYSDRHALTGAELSEIDRRLGEASPAYADPAEIATLFGKPFSE
jgi:hypothetical protein